MSPPDSFHALVPARVGLVGNPSDGFGGAVVSAIVDDLAARVTATRLDAGLRITSPHADAVEWASADALADDVRTHGHTTPHRLVTAAIEAVDQHLATRRDRPRPAVHVEWSTSIPRSVGLAGSSAIAVGVVEAVAAIAGQEFDPRVVAALALRAETEGLGIAAGWQDRIVQAHRGAVLVDASEMTSVEGVAAPTVRRLSGRPVDAVVGWRATDSEDSAVYHAELRRRSGRDGGADQLAASMGELAELARNAAGCLERSDTAELAALVDASWEVRVRSMPLHPRHAELVELARDLGVAATSPGSGGSVVAVPTTRESTDLVLVALRAAGAEARVVTLR